MQMQIDNYEFNDVSNARFMRRFNGFTLKPTSRVIVARTPSGKISGTVTAQHNTVTREDGTSGRVIEVTFGTGTSTKAREMLTSYVRDHFYHYHRKMQYTN